MITQKEANLEVLDYLINVLKEYEPTGKYAPKYNKAKEKYTTVLMSRYSTLSKHLYPVQGEA
jgi:hypothetical protein